MPKVKDGDDYLDIQIGRFELFFNKNYRLLTIANELSLGLLYMTGSILFMLNITPWAMICYLLGAAQMVARPLMKLFHASYMRRVTSANNFSSEEAYKQGKEQGEEQGREEAYSQENHKKESAQRQEGNS